MPDKDGYPTDDELKKIAEWPLDGNPASWLDFIRPCWWSPTWDCFWHEQDAIDDLLGKPAKRYSMSTGGWSGNEDIIDAMMENKLLWLSTWVQSMRGGHHIFEAKKG